MTRGKIVLITDKTTYTSTEFNGGMYWDIYGKEIVHALHDVNSYKKYVWLISTFNTNHFEYNEQLIYNLRTFKKRKLLRLFDMTDNYLKKWFSDYLYIKNIGKNPLIIKTLNYLNITLKPNGIQILNYGKYTETCHNRSIETNFTLSDELIEFCDTKDWSVSLFDTEVQFEKFSPAGEDFLFYANVFELADEIKKYADDFDPDEHTEMWVEFRGKRGVPKSIRTLIDDADAIKIMLTDLSEQVNLFFRRKEL